MNYAAKISYLGKNYSGWQIQPDAISIQEIIEEVLTKIAGSEIRITGAGRTDKGVNAWGQVASFSMEKVFTPEKLRLAINFYLPEDIRIMKIFNVPEDFNARYSAILREYKYFIYHDSVCPPMLNNFVWWRKGRKWDFELVKEACKLIEGRHDFKAFCRAVECPEDSFRTVESLKIRNKGNLSIISIKAKSFLTNMVRIIIGNINSIAIGRNNLEWLKDLLNGRERENSEMTAPACGLWFWKVKYKNLSVN
ncbi:MAG: tRNA pseudouridine(38-40) synthase TruA [Synergistaceae bacterium]|nr:tRNA pseudouridine(38-40) synthase TruA [Synergistaceae bacterium]MBQ6435156.1 tRNA pseudouridine(38-40) synthase TruA [Synergistaceae bacterium]MBR0253465.1 tRNA pseudouridine(38-40) synthase TruA [Synergistaceae bacterium]